MNRPDINQRRAKPVLPRGLPGAEDLRPTLFPAKPYKHVGCRGSQVKGASSKTLAVCREWGATEIEESLTASLPSRLRLFCRGLAVNVWPGRSALSFGNMPRWLLVIGHWSLVIGYWLWTLRALPRGSVYAVAVCGIGVRDANQPAVAFSNDATALAPYSRLACCTRISALIFQSPCGSCLRAH